MSILSRIFHLNRGARVFYFDTLDIRMKSTVFLSATQGVVLWFTRKEDIHLHRG